MVCDAKDRLVPARRQRGRGAERHRERAAFENDLQVLNGHAAEGASERARGRDGRVPPWQR